MRYLEHSTKDVHEHTNASLSGFHHAERITAQHGCSFLRCFRWKEILQGFNGCDAELLEIPAHDGILKNFLAGVLKHFTHPPPVYGSRTIGNQAHHCWRYFTGLLDLLNGVTDPLAPDFHVGFVFLQQRVDLLRQQIKLFG